jgi:LuxR family maltose regulon positive regulatory protein
MSMSSSPAKVTRPVLADVLRRERLFKQIDSYRSRPITWVAGPAGSGKTVLVSSYLEDRKLPCLWYKIDQGDNDPATFFYYLGQAAKVAVPRKRKPLPLLAPEYLPGLEEFTFRYFEDLFNRLKSPFFIVFDDYQELSETSPLHSVIRNGLTRIPQGINVMFVSRHDPLPGFSRLRASRNLGQLGGDDLNLTLDEFTNILKMTGKRKLTQKATNGLYKRLGGWPAGLILLLERERLLGSDISAFDAESAEDIFDYFGEEILDKIDPETRNFYIKTSFLPRMTPQMAERLTGIERAGDILSYLSRRNLFTEKHFETEPVYSYHPLFREFLQEQARSTLKKKELRNLMRDAADILADQQLYEDAADLFNLAQDWEGLMMLAVQRAPVLIAQGRHRTLCGWIEKAPFENRERNPWINYWYAAGLLPFDLYAARGNFTRAYDEFLRRDDPAGTFLAWAGVVETYNYDWGDFQPLDHWIEELERILSHFKDFPSREIESKVVLGMFTALMYRQPYFNKTAVWGERARELIERPVDKDQQIMIGNQLLHSFYWIGDVFKSEAIITVLMPRIQSPEAMPLSTIYFYSFKAAFEWMTGDIEESNRSTMAGLELTEKSGIHYWDLFLLGFRTCCALSSGSLEEARALIDRMEPLVNPDRLMTHMQFRFLTAWEALLRKDNNVAVREAGLCVELSRKAGVRYSLVVCLIFQAQVLLASGNLKEALRSLDEGIRLALEFAGSEKKIAPLVRFLYFQIVSHLAMIQGKEKKALALIGQLMEFGRERRLINVPGAQSEVLAQLCAKAMQAHIEEDYVRTLINKCNLVPVGPHEDLDKWPWPMRIFTLGQFRVEVGGKDLVFKGKIQQKPLSLLKLLLSMGGYEVPQDEIIDLMWPNADGDMAHTAFTTTLHRLRKLIGIKEALILKEGKLSLNPVLWWFDARAFAGVVEKALEKLEKKVSPSELREITNRVLDFYGGHFLSADTILSWTTAKRSELKSEYLLFLRRVVLSYRILGKWKMAADFLEKTISEDASFEEDYCDLMECYLKLSQRSKALAVYHRCVAALDETIGVKPSRNMIALYERALSQT